MERTEFLSRRDFLQKAIALGTGALIEAMLCKEAAAAMQGLADARLPQVNVLTQNAVASNANVPNPTSAPAPQRAISVPDLYASNKTQIDLMQKGNWEGLFFLASDTIQQLSKQYDIPADLMHALCFRESVGIPTNRSKVRTSSGRYSYAQGAIGLAQIMYFHAKQPDGSVVDLTHMPTNLLKMAQIFSAYRSKHDGDPDWARKTLYDYNAGPNRSVTPSETIAYADQIVALWKNPKRLKEDYIERAWADMSLLYWELLPVNPLAEPFVRTGVDFWEPYAGQPNHTGLDLGGPQIQIGTPIRAVAPGKVVYTGRLYDILGISFSGRGNTVVIEHRPTNPLVKTTKFITTGYCHMSEFAKGIAPGVYVERGQLIGYIGMTGWTTGPHLHFECARNVPVNPTTRKMAREDGWFHPFLVMPPNQNFPGAKRLA